MRYLSRNKNLVLTVQPAELGDKTTPGSRGHHVRFSDGVYDTTNKAEIRAIESNPQFGRTITRIDAPGKPQAAPKAEEG